MNEGGFAMSAATDFLKAALPWIVIGVVIAAFLAAQVQKNKKE